MQQEFQQIEYTYYAFISYKRKDEKWARWLQRRLQNYRLPSRLCKQYRTLSPRLSPVFLDKENLTSGELKKSLQKELSASRFLIVICSRAAYEEPFYLNHEIQSFLDSGHTPEQIIPFIIDESPAPEKECFPPVLQEVCQTSNLLGINVNDSGRRNAFLKVIAYMHNLKLTEVESAEDKRRRRIRWTLAICSTFVFLCLAVTGYKLWDYYVPKVKYYLDYTTKWGVPVGIGEVDKDQMGETYGFYAIESVRNQVTELRYENIHGKLQEQQNPSLMDRPARITYVIDEKTGQLIETVDYDATNKALLKRTYTYGNNEMLVYLWKPHNPTLSASLATKEQWSYEYNANSFLPGEVPDAVARIMCYGVRFDENTGYISEMRFYSDTYRTPAADATGILGYLYTCDEYGRIVSQKNIWPIEEADNEYYDKVLYVYQGYDLIQVKYVNSRGKLAYGPEGVSVCDYAYDENHNTVECAFSRIEGMAVTEDWDDRRMHYEQGNLVSIGEGTREVSWEYSYDASGNPVEGVYVINDWFPTYGLKQYMAWRAVYDEQNRVIQKTYYGTDMEPLEPVEHYSYDEWGNLCRFITKDLDGMYMLNKEGWAGWEKQYDGNLLMETMYYVPDKVLDLDLLNEDDRNNQLALIFQKGKKATDYVEPLVYEKYQYDSYGNLKRVDYLDAKGELLKNKDGYSSIYYEHNEQGLLCLFMYLDTENKPVRAGWYDFASVSYEYSEYGQVTKVVYYDENGEPRPESLSTNVVGLEISYYPNRLIERITYIDANGLPTEGDKGYAIEEYEYDAQGRMTWHRYWDSAGNSVGYYYDPMFTFGDELWLSYAQKHIEYIDTEEKSITIETHYDGNGNLAECNGGGARIVTTEWLNDNEYDEERLEYSADGQLLERTLTSSFPTGNLESIIKLNGSNQIMHAVYFYEQGGTKTECYCFFAYGDGYDQYSLFFDPRTPILFYAKEEYNENGDTISVEYFDTDDNPTCYPYGCHKEVYEYNSEGQVIRHVCYNVAGDLQNVKYSDHIAAYCEYFYDETGREIESRSYRDDGSISRIIKTSYLDSGAEIEEWIYYDESGNITEHEIFD